MISCFLSITVHGTAFICLSQLGKVTVCIFCNCMSSVSSAPWLQGEGAAGPAHLHRHGRRANPQTPRFLPGPPHHRQNCHHHQLREDHRERQGPGDPTGAQKQHESHVRKTRTSHRFHHTQARPDLAH